MKPVSSNIKANNKCLNPVTTKCVTWDGPEITCLDGTVLCKGQSIEITLYAIATKLCQVINELNLEGINPCINNINDDTSVNINQNSTLQEVFSGIIQKVCSLTDRVTTLENEECPVLLVTVAETSCFRDPNYPNWNVENQPSWEEYGPNTIPATVFAELVAVAVCAMLIDITALQNSVTTIKQEIQDLWVALENCTSNCNNLVLPTCTYDFTSNPDGEPVSIQTAYSWLEKEFCDLKSSIGTPDEIIDAVQKQCPDLTFLERLSSGGQMGDIAGWNSNPITLADSVGNLWLTVCDMRQAVANILNGCCFTPCSYLEFGYDLVWDVNGAYVDVVFNGSGPHLVYTDLSVPPAGTSPWNAIPSLGPPPPPPPWVLTQFPIASQTNVIITISDGSVSATYDTLLKINDWAIESNVTNNGYRITFASIPGYNVTSLNQTINFLFDYGVDDGTSITPCQINQTDGFEYECCAPTAYTCDTTLNMIVDQNGVGFTCQLTGLVLENPLLADSTVTGAGTGTDTLQDTGGIDFSTIPLSTGASGGSIVYINYNQTTNTYDQCRYVTAINAADEIEVNAAWAPALVGTETYVIKDNYYNNPGTSTNDCVDSLLNLTVKVIEVNAGFVKDDPNTWNIVYQNASISWVAISTVPGFQVPTGYVDPNKEYVIAIYANYPCGQSEPSFVGNLSPILASVSIQLGTLTSPAAQAFNPSSTASSVTDILSNNVVPNYEPSESATVTSPALFGLDLPVGGNLTQFRITPAAPTWAFNIGLTPQAFCACGLNRSDPWGTTTIGSQTVPTRNVVLGQYRAYEVKLFKNDIVNNTTIPILDSNLNPYVTNSLADPTINFSSNTPTVSGGGIIVSVPGTYTESTYPVVIQYNPNPYAVNTSIDFHKVYIRNDVPQPITINVINGTGGPVTFRAWVDIVALKWDDTTSQYIPYSPNRTQTVTTGSVLVPNTGLPVPIIIPTINPYMDCKYGDALYAQVRFTDNGGVSFTRAVNYVLALLPATVPTLTAVNYSCSGTIQSAVRTTNQPLPAVPGGTPATSTGVFTNPANEFYIPLFALITEDYEVRTILNYTC